MHDPSGGATRRIFLGVGFEFPRHGRTVRGAARNSSLTLERGQGPTHEGFDPRTCDEINLHTIPIAAALLGAGTVSAQDLRINVTGTNIKRVDTETAAPIETITREDIQASGLQTIAAVVQSITANNNGTISNAFVNGFGAGASGVSLRGLGANNTLVLLNGRRLAVYGLADDGQRSFVNLNQVPFDAVERIEILKDGASAIYGSDAVAGVVNIILREQYTGVTATATVVRRTRATASSSAARSPRASAT